MASFCQLARRTFTFKDDSNRVVATLSGMVNKSLQVGEALQTIVTDQGGQVKAFYDEKIGALFIEELKINSVTLKGIQLYDQNGRMFYLVGKKGLGAWGNFSNIKAGDCEHFVVKDDSHFTQDLQDPFRNRTGGGGGSHKDDVSKNLLDQLNNQATVPVVVNPNDTNEVFTTTGRKLEPDMDMISVVTELFNELGLPPIPQVAVPMLESQLKHAFGELHQLRQFDGSSVAGSIILHVASMRFDGFAVCQLSLISAQSQPNNPDATNIEQPISLAQPIQSTQVVSMGSDPVFIGFVESNLLHHSSFDAAGLEARRKQSSMPFYIAQVEDPVQRQMFHLARRMVSVSKSMYVGRVTNKDDSFDMPANILAQENPAVNVVVRSALPPIARESEVQHIPSAEKIGAFVAEKSCDLVRSDSENTGFSDRTASIVSLASVSSSSSAKSCEKTKTKPKMRLVLQGEGREASFAQSPVRSSEFGLRVETARFDVQEESVPTPRTKKKLLVLTDKPKTRDKTEINDAPKINPTKIRKPKTKLSAKIPRESGLGKKPAIRKEQRPKNVEEEKRKGKTKRKKIRIPVGRNSSSGKKELRIEDKPKEAAKQKKSKKPVNSQEKPGRKFSKREPLKEIKLNNPLEKRKSWKRTQRTVSQKEDSQKEKIRKTGPHKSDSQRVKKQKSVPQKINSPKAEKPKAEKQKIVERNVTSRKEKSQKTKPTSVLSSRFRLIKENPKSDNLKTKKTREKSKSPITRFSRRGVSRRTAIHPLSSIHSVSPFQKVSPFHKLIGKTCEVPKAKNRKRARRDLNPWQTDFLNPKTHNSRLRTIRVRHFWRFTPLPS